MKKLQFFSFFKYLIICGVLVIFTMAWAAFVPLKGLNYTSLLELSLPYFIPAFIVYGILIFMSFKKWRLAFILGLCITIYYIASGISIGFSPWKIMEYPLQPQVLIITTILTFIVSLIGTVLVIKDYLGRHKTNQ